MNEAVTDERQGFAARVVVAPRSAAGISVRRRGIPPRAKAPCPSQADQEPLRLHTAMRGDHALLVLEASSRVVALWEPLPALSDSVTRVPAALVA
jgi:hypothetical protein